MGIRLSDSVGDDALTSHGCAGACTALSCGVHRLPADPLAALRFPPGRQWAASGVSLSPTHKIHLVRKSPCIYQSNRALFQLPCRAAIAHPDKKNVETQKAKKQKAETTQKQKFRGQLRAGVGLKLP